MIKFTLIPIIIVFISWLAQVDDRPIKVHNNFSNRSLIHSRWHPISYIERSDLKERKNITHTWRARKWLTRASFFSPCITWSRKMYFWWERETFFNLYNFWRKSYCNHFSWFPAQILAAQIFAIVKHPKALIINREKWKIQDMWILSFPQNASLMK